MQLKVLQPLGQDQANPAESKTAPRGFIFTSGAFASLSFTCPEARTALKKTGLKKKIRSCCSIAPYGCLDHKIPQICLETPKASELESSNIF
ncbi:hypothetical protein AV530_002018 [Patagioenas fasciata monilis]|uniref:Uncharacterized protein n=1 Tax=Patagioenas fasciata monilis TaxID=372326 RepID=A0A1V4J6Q6_PATFA|nr:hypothetical protein AV530_002018 [Patagioenas fasciata monilis]